MSESIRPGIYPPLPTFFDTHEELDLVLHTFLDPHIPLSQAHIQAEEIKRTLRHEYPCLGSVAIHTEPPE